VGLRTSSGLSTAPQALAWIREHQLATLAGPEPPPSLVLAVTGSAVRGSWWAHPKGGTIYALAQALDDAPDVLSTELVGGRVTFVQERLWPALGRVVTDAKWRRARSADLSSDARLLLGRVERSGHVRLDELRGDKKALSRARTELERAALVISTQLHTQSGKHSAVLRSWREWSAAIGAASKLDFDHARAVLEERGWQFPPAS
jgi:hypothetical protein